jgi:OHCU decarboxylase
VTIGELNVSSRAAFVDAVGWVFEHSPWVAERVWDRRPFDDVDHLHATMVAEVARATRDEQIRLLRAHPDLGARTSMSVASTGEQAGAGLNRVSASEHGSLQQLNAAYREKFGFPFVLAVKGSTPAQVVDALRERLPRELDEERTEALAQVYRIARFRLDDLIRT